MKTIINIKTDKDVKETAKKIAGELGLSLSTIMSAYLKQFIRSRAVYFSSVPRMSRELEALLGRVEQDLKKRKNTSRPLASADEVAEYLEAL